MKFFLALNFLLSFIGSSFSQTNDNIKSTTDSIVKIFTWDIEKVDKGSLMYLDVPYQRDNADSTEYLTLTVAKDTASLRPAFISVIIPNNIVQSNGIFIAFASNVTSNGQRSMKLEKGTMVRINFESCNDETCTARIINGYASSDDGTQQDIFKNFLHYDHVLFLFVYKNGSHKSVAVPLFSFKEQYKNLDLSK